MKILITSGGTKIPIDTVRDITNMSTGTFGTKIGEEALRKGHSVVFVRAKGSKSPMRRTFEVTTEETKYLCENFYNWVQEREQWAHRYQESVYKTFEQYERCLQFAITGERPDVVVLAAAVSDYYVPKPMEGKLRSNDMLTIKLESLPKIINKVKGWAPNAKLVGFKLMVNANSSDLILAGKKSCEENGCSFVVANDLEDIKRGDHRLTLVFPTAPHEVYKTDPTDPNYLARVVVEHIEKL